MKCSRRVQGENHDAQINTRGFKMHTSRSQPTSLHHCCSWAGPQGVERLHHTLHQTSLWGLIHGSTAAFICAGVLFAIWFWAQQTCPDDAVISTRQRMQGGLNQTLDLRHRPWLQAQMERQWTGPISCPSEYVTAALMTERMPASWTSVD